MGILAFHVACRLFRALLSLCLDSEQGEKNSRPRRCTRKSRKCLLHVCILHISSLFSFFLFSSASSFPVFFFSSYLALLSILIRLPSVIFFFFFFFFVCSSFFSSLSCTSTSLPSFHVFPLPSFYSFSPPSRFTLPFSYLFTVFFFVFPFSLSTLSFYSLSLHTSASFPGFSSSCFILFSFLV